MTATVATAAKRNANLRGRGRISGNGTRRKVSPAGFCEDWSAYENGRKQDRYH
jgi:hypothetical protein